MAVEAPVEGSGAAAVLADRADAGSVESEAGSRSGRRAERSR